MKAIVRDTYGPPDVLELQEVEKPELADDGVLVRVRAASVNRVDWYDVTGTPWIARPMTGLRGPKSRLIGRDFAGTVEAVGKDVTDLQPGDDVFGGKSGGGSFAEYVCVRDGSRAEAGQPDVRGGGGRARRGAHRAPGSSRQGAASAGAEGPRQRRLGRGGHVRRADRQSARRGGDRRLQHEERRPGAIARRRPRHRLHPRGLHPERPALRPDPRRRGEQVVVGVQARARTRTRRSSSSEDRRALVCSGRSVTSSRCGWRRCAAARRPSSSSRSSTGRTWRSCESCSSPGKVKPVVERRYELSEVADAFRYLGEGHAQGKIVITI